MLSAGSGETARNGCSSPAGYGCCCVSAVNIVCSLARLIPAVTPWWPVGAKHQPFSLALTSATDRIAPWAGKLRPTARGFAHTGLIGFRWWAAMTAGGAAACGTVGTKDHSPVALIFTVAGDCLATGIGKFGLASRAFSHTSLISLGRRPVRRCARLTGWSDRQLLGLSKGRGNR